MDRQLVKVLELSEELAGVPDREAYVRAATEGLGLVLPANDIFWVESDYTQSRAVVHHGQPFALDDDLSARVGACVDHPSVQSYLADPTDLSPRRLSDVATRTQLHATQAYGMVGDRLGLFQLGLIVNVGNNGGHGWILGRDRSEYTDTEVDLAHGLVAALAAWDKVYLPATSPPHVDSDGGRIRTPLTGRELEVLRLVAHGLTATACAHVLRISPLTVRKHLENAYAKLEVHDRLLAVAVAQGRGLIGQGLTF